MKQEAVNAVREAQYELINAAKHLRFALHHETDGQIVDTLYHTRQAVEKTQILMTRIEGENEE